MQLATVSFPLQMAKLRGGRWSREVARDGAGLSRLPARFAKSPAAAALGEAVRCLCHLTQSGAAMRPVLRCAWQLGWQ